MTDLTPQTLLEFTKRYPLDGGKLLGIRLMNRPKKFTDAVITIRVRDKTTSERVKLKLYLFDVEEYRLQRRPTESLTRLRHVRLAYFHDFAYVNLNAFLDDEAPTLLDFKVSDTYIAAAEMAYEITVLPSPTSDSHAADA